MAALADYIGATNGLYRNVGKFGKDLNSEVTRMGTTLPANQAASSAGTGTIGSASGTESRFEVLSMTGDAYLKAQLSTLDFIESLARAMDRRMLDRTTVLVPLRVDEPDIQKVMSAVIDDMYSNHTVNASSFTFGTVTAGASNVGNGAAVITDILDGVSAPCQRFRAHRKYLGVTTELVCAETVKIQCIRDAYGQVLPGFEGNKYGVMIEPSFIAGNELFCVFGKAQPAYRRTSHPSYGVGYGLYSEGSGPGPVFYGINVNIDGDPSTDLIENSDFENWSVTDVPDNWTYNETPATQQGTTTTHVLKSTSIKFNGSASLQYKGDGAQATIRRATLVDPTYWIGYKRYYCSFWAYGESGLTGTMTAQMVGTGYTAGATEKVSVTAPTTAAWTHYGFWFNAPSSFPSDWGFKFELSGTPASAKSLYFDELRIMPAAWHGGFGLQVYNGSTPPVVGDFWTCAITANSLGVIQEFEKKWHGVQLPSNAAAGEDVVDTFFT